MPSSVSVGDFSKNFSAVYENDPLSKCLDLFSALKLANMLSTLLRISQKRAIRYLTQ